MDTNAFKLLLNLTFRAQICGIRRSSRKNEQQSQPPASSGRHNVQNLFGKRASKRMALLVFRQLRTGISPTHGHNRTLSLFPPRARFPP